MKDFKVVLFDVGDRRPVPEWVTSAFAEAGFDFAFHPCTTREELAQYAGDADVVWLHGSYLLTAENLAAIPNCGAIIRTGSGTDNVAVDAATRLGIVVANTPEAHSNEVADHAVALLFALVRQVGLHDRNMRSGMWDRSTYPRWHFRGQTLGLVAYGHIGQMVARKLSGFELRVLVYDPYVSAERLVSDGVQAAELDELLAESDFVSLHCPLTEATYHLIGERELRLMKPAALLINTSRGEVLDEPALVRALQEGWIAGAGLDVFDPEPPAPDNPLLVFDNVLTTPHIAGYSDEHEDACWRLSMEAILALAKGKWPRSYVNPGVQPRWNLA